jgi:immune inhibitor A
MASGSWGLGGDRPVHPSAWCKATQGWVNVVTQTSNATVSIADVKTGRTAYRLWKDGAGGNEYFLVENRQQVGYDASMPGQGLLVWHIDDAVSTNRDESHYKVALMQADGRRDLETNTNRGDAGDAFPGSAGNTSFTDTSTPNSKSYAGSSTCVAVTSISPSAATMTAHLGVRCFVKPPKDLKELKERPKDFKDIKERPKEIVKERPKELKEFKEGKELKERPKEIVKEVGEKRPKELKDRVENKLPDVDLPFDRWRWGLRAGEPGQQWQQGQQGDYGQGPHGQYGDQVLERLGALEEMVSALVDALGGGVAGQPFIGGEERPQLGYDVGGPDLGQAGGTDLDQLRAAMSQGSAEAKQVYDALPPQ